MLIKQLPDSYLTFKLDNDSYAINVKQVLEILEIKPITRVPKSPSYLKGVINLRGNILPVADTRNKLGMAEAPLTIESCILVLTVDTGKEALLVGAIVDSVQEVIEIQEENILPPPGIGIAYKEEYIRGMGKVDETFFMILDICKVFSADNFFRAEPLIREPA